MICGVCGATSTAYMETRLLGKYDVVYFRCNSCRFVQTEQPYWLAEAYGSAITSLDVGLIQRNQLMTGIVRAVIHKWFDPRGRFVDYGGGYGMLVRMMRDRGYDFHWYDTHCENLFAQTFDAQLPAEGDPPYTLLTAFEVAEHMVNPSVNWQQMGQYSRNMLFSTQLQPEGWSGTPDSWWYVLPETGQHVSLYSRKSLFILAEQQGLYLYTNDTFMHLFTTEPVSPLWFRALTNRWGTALYNQLTGNQQPSLLTADFARLRKQKIDSFLPSMY